MQATNLMNLKLGERMRNLALLPCLVLLFTFCSSMTFAATPEAGKPLQDEPLAVSNRATSICVITEGTDSLGARLATRLKERFNQSSLFRLTSEDENEGPELRLLLTTQPEFPSRPGLGSIYGVCWVFRQGKGYLGYLLAREIGAITPDEVDGLVDKLVERTDGIAAKYSNLWK